MEQRVQHLLASAGSNIGRLEVLDGPTGRRTLPDEVKAAIVAESFEPGVKVSAVARGHGLTPQHLTLWRRAAREGQLMLPAAGEESFPNWLWGIPARASRVIQAATQRSVSRRTGSFFVCLQTSAYPVLGT